MTDTTNTVYTAITFAPVQGFIEKSRKLRDLYGSSFILSYLSHEVCLQAGQEHTIISPAIINLTQGTPNFIIIRGLFPAEKAKTALSEAWRRLVNQCRAWIERELPNFRYEWDRDWNLWANHAWEFFWAIGSSIDQACENLGATKQSRRWIGINWTGESSTLSGADAIAWHGMGRIVKAQERSFKNDEIEISSFYQALQHKLDGVVGKIEVTAEPDLKEQLSIPELIKRLITYDAVVATELKIPKEQRPKVEIPPGFRDLNRFEENCWTGWFKGDGDRMGAYLSTLNEQERKDFSHAIMKWGEEFQHSLPKTNKTGTKPFSDGRIIYSGGDDFLGVLYRNSPDPAKATLQDIEAFKPLTTTECISWFQQFPQIWQQHKQPISVSVGFVWAAPKVPQRDVLQHCNAAESNAKRAGRDRIALRVLFSNSTHLEWICPWRFLPVLEDYRDPQDGKQDWVHFYQDVAILEARHAFQGTNSKGQPVNNQLEVALALFSIYFNSDNTSSSHRSNHWQELEREVFYQLMATALVNTNQPDWWQAFGDDKDWWNQEEADPINPAKTRIKSGILGDRNYYKINGVLDLDLVKEALTDWIINLAKVGFYLCSDT